jgi:hypothetical protein
MKCVTTRNKRITSDFESSKARILPSWQAWYQVDVERFKLKSAQASSTDIPPPPPRYFQGALRALMLRHWHIRNEIM